VYVATKVSAVIKEEPRDERQFPFFFAARLFTVRAKRRKTPDSGVFLLLK
jgi:hypothetical protein